MEANEEIVISGISGRYPECDNIEELMEALLQGVDLVTDTERRFPRGVMGNPSRNGILTDLGKFDATFFGVHAKQAEFMDPRHRILCETVYECIIDAGYNPQELRGSKTGVYVGMAHFTNPEKLRERDDSNGYTNIGINSCMAANRISYFFDFKGKSYTLDTACSSAMYAMVNAIDDIRSGHADSAIVCGAHILFHPHESSEFNKLNMLSADGKCKVFSTTRDGYVRSESIMSMLLQKKSDSRRVYATVLDARSNTDGYKLEGITFPSTDMQLDLLKEIYSEDHGVNPNDVTYVEAHGTGTPIGDIQELKAITETFCRNRKAPLPVGAVKSNMGHSETSSGLCSVYKVLIAMESGVIPANLHTQPLDTDLPGIKEGKIQIVTENLPWNGGIVAVNSFGFGGANAHVALKSNPKEKSKAYKRPKYRLVQVSGRTEEAVNYLLDEVEKNRDDEEFLALMDEIHKMNVDGHNFRGYTILGKQPKREVSRYNKSNPIWLIFTGMGCQWLGMGKDLMNNEIFRNTIKRCAIALKPYDIDLEELLTSTDPKIFNKKTTSFVTIGAMEIAMTDLLYSMGIVPDGIAGHSLGEVGCAYADGQITPEEAILLAYARGYATQSVKMPAGAMAAVGLSMEKCSKMLPDDIFIACQNGKNSVTISGLEDTTTTFVDKLTSQGIFAKKVESGGLAYHTKYIRDSGPYLHDFVQKVLKTPKLRSSKWLSTSVKENQKHERWAQYNCAEYHLNNFCNTVLFDEVYKHVPENAIVVEVAPHGLMQAILKRELDPSVTVLSLANRNSPDNEEFFLSAIGKIYLAGGQPNLKKLYGGVVYPVSRGTKMLSSLVKWDHSINWLVPVWTHNDSIGHTITVNISNKQHAYLAGHNIDGRVLMPATGYVELAWRTLASLNMKDPENLPVIVENVKFKRATVLPADTDVKFLVNIMKQSGYFEIFEGGSVVSSGTIYTTKDITSAYSDANYLDVPMNEYLPLTSEDVYKECHLRKYMYEGLFQGIKECDVQGLRGRIKWQDNFTSFLDAMLHLSIISDTNRDLILPSIIKRVVIDPQGHLKQVAEREDLPIFYNPYLNVIKSGSVEIRGLDSTKAPTRKQAQEDPVLETYEFVPYETFKTDEFDLDSSLSVAVQIILQNSDWFGKTLKICEFPGDDSTKLVAKIKNIFNLQPMVETEYVKYSKGDTQTKFDTVVFIESLLQEVEVSTVVKRLNESGMIIYQGDILKISQETVNVIYKANGIYLLRPNQELPTKFSVVNVSTSSLGWLENIKNLTQSHSKEVVYLVSQNENTSGVVGLVKCLLIEPNGVKFRCILIEDAKSPTFSLNDDTYRSQLTKDLTFNVLRNGRWGTFVHLPLKPIENKQVNDATVSILTIGDLSTLCWIEKPSNQITKSEAKSEKVYVYYAPLNFRDVMLASGKLQQSQGNDPNAVEISIGIEYSGITTTGRRVMGMLPAEGLSLQIQSDPGFTWDVPKEWSLDEAATVPAVYATCYYAMIMRGRMQPGESILIHAGTGGVGLAAIAIALSMNCTIFTTVGSQEKREYLKKLYPQLKDENIGNSRNASFEKMVMQNTKGRGVDLVLNSLSGDLFRASLQCTAIRGRFLEIGKVDFMNSTPIESKMFLKNCSLHGVHLDELFTSQSQVKQDLKDLLNEGVKDGVVKPLPRTIFKEDKVEDAFRFLSSGKHKGKVMVELRQENPATVRTPIRSINAIPKVYFDPNKSYIVVGGLGGVGLELTDWLIRRGATKIILNSRRQIHSGYQSYCLKKWNGVTVKINTHDTTTIEGATNLVTFAKRSGPVGGVFNLALVLKDSLIENQTIEMYEEVFKPKIVSGHNMDVVTRKQCPELDHFVVFSSVTSGRGNSGQSNYGMANSALEQLCENRRNDNLPSLAVQWGPIGEVGALVRNKIINKLAEKMVAQNINSCMDTLEKFMLQNVVVGSSVILASKNDVRAKGVNKTPSEAVAHILGIRNLELIDKKLTLAQLGLDSLMIAEIKQTLYRNYQLEVNTDEIRDITFQQLIDMSKTDENNNTIAINGTTEEINEMVTSILHKDAIVTLKEAANSAKTIFMIHPIQGHVEILREIASQLNGMVYGLQNTREEDFDNIPEYASHLIKQVKTKQPHGPYFLCGYSFGAAVAIEMGMQLERTGDQVEMVLLDGSPAYVRKTLRYFFLIHEESNDKSKTAILDAFVSAFPNLDASKIEKDLTATVGWEEQLKIVGDTVSKVTNLDAELVAISADRYYKRCLAGFSYEPQSTFKGKTLLIRSDLEHTFTTEDYELQKICKGKVELVKLKGDHDNILFGENAKIISNKINSLL